MGDRIIAVGDRAFCEVVKRIIDVGGLPIIKAKHGPIKWYKQRKVLVIPWGVSKQVPGGFATELSDEMIEAIISAPKGGVTKAVLAKCGITLKW